MDVNTAILVDGLDVIKTMIFKKKNKNIVPDEFYVINQPKKLGVVIVEFKGVNPHTPLTPELHEALDKMHQSNDLVFMFPKEFTQHINPEKFSTLYQASMYVVEGDNEVWTFVKTLDYLTEIFQKQHAQFSFFQAGDFDSVVNLDETLKKLGDIKTLGLKSPVLEIHRYQSQEFYEVYKSENKENIGIHKIYYSDSPIIRMSLLTVNVLRNIKPEYYRTFTGYLKDFIPSAIKYYELEYIDETL